MMYGKIDTIKELMLHFGVRQSEFLKKTKQELSPTNFSGWTNKPIMKAPLWFLNEMYENFGIAYDVRHKKFYLDESQRV